jgi:hypothetical protein
LGPFLTQKDRYYISALGILFAVAVSFNTLALQNQMKNLPRSISEVEEQVDKIENLLEPVIRRKGSKSQKYYPYIVI